ncbi:hypothetical protein [Streptomyces sp. NBC_01518]|uniref:hypothetical protein n=1 Tax=Streptomyces sp. NBC_01518 TaxID=2903891 RepID=UPI00386E540E
MTPSDIPKLPGLGRTWYKRGARYWLRRSSGALLWAVLVAFMGYVVFGLYLSFRVHLPPIPRMVWDWTQGAASCVALVWGWVKQRRDIRKRLLNPPTPTEAWVEKRYATQRGQGLGRALVLPALLVLPVVPALFGWCVGAVAAVFTVREYPSEIGARRALEHSRGSGHALAGDQKRLRR